MSMGHAYEFFAYKLLHEYLKEQGNIVNIFMTINAATWMKWTDSIKDTIINTQEEIAILFIKR